MEFLQRHQLDFMLVLIGICIMLAITTLITGIISKKRKMYMLLFDLSHMVMLIADRLSYIYRGDLSTLGFYMVRISNYLVFACVLLAIYSFSLYLGDLLTNEGQSKKLPWQMTATYILFLAGEIVLLVSQFTGFYYYFDEQNLYTRGRGFAVSYAITFAMFFLQLWVIIKNRKKLKRTLTTLLIIFTVVPYVAAIAQFFLYGLSLINLTTTSLMIVLYITNLFDMNKAIEKSTQKELELLRHEQKSMHTLFGQTSQTLASAIDAKDTCTHGHSTRVAEYAKKIAVQAGLSEQECEEIYFAGLLHDVGKIGIPDEIINKNGKLTTEEFDIIKQHPVIGAHILSQISQAPYLSIGAHYHHERYDGKGYPTGIKGEDIPEIARIIAVADAYDAMTSKRSYRAPLVQEKVREQLVEGAGTQFDPVFAKIMAHLIDLDPSYKMKETSETVEVSDKNEILCTEYRSSFSAGFIINDMPTKIKLHFTTNEFATSLSDIPSFIMFDSLDGRIHKSELHQKELNYFEYGELHFDGTYSCTGARKIQADIKDFSPADFDPLEYNKKGLNCEIEAVRVYDHALVTIKTDYKAINFIIAMPDSVRFLYLALTGSWCYISDISSQKDKSPVDKKFIPRIADEISFIKGKPQGDIPNIQIDGWCTDATKGIALNDADGTLTLSFHALTLPTARLVWHCPYIRLFYSDDATATGANYIEYAIIRFDGETWESSSLSKSAVIVNKTKDFTSWDAWKAANKKGSDCVVELEKEGNKVTVHTQNHGIELWGTTIIDTGSKDPTVYVAITGDQCAITNIKAAKKA